ncbi:hypothetical protein NKR23_g12392 [Pleurostoma richardsiae]|uniref:Uncharacterized protein n=1 Tax=Pleurostoma richardsiae TaxID=41990 RepID=A0AA38R9B0_9PEZI|nr:hypothetical protein NKR23_g12392 [Pleurostoma richardsiae]
MSLVPEKGVLRKLYNDANAAGARHEFPSSSFWQVILQRTFWEDHFIVICEQPPDNSLRRVDIVVRFYNEDDDTLLSIIFHEAKGPNGNAKEVEEQAYGAATLAIARDRLTGVYAITTIGTRFRAWYLGPGDQALKALYGLDEGQTRRRYVDIGSEEGHEFHKAVDLIKANPPQRLAPVVPSQSLSLLSETNFNEEIAEGSWAAETSFSGGATGINYVMRQATDQAQDPWPAPSAGDYGGSENIQDVSGQVQYAEYMGRSMQYTEEVYSPPHGEPVAGPSGASRRGDGGSVERQWQAVSAKKEVRLMHPDEVVFKDEKGKTKTTLAKDWKRATYEGRTVWTLEGKKTTYYTKKIG